MKGVFIVIEGADATGKETQARMLVEGLRREGVNAEYLSFPDYGSEYGRMIKEYLKTGKHPVEETVLLYLLDMYSKKGLIEEKSGEGVLVCDRYWYSNLAYQTSRPGGEALSDWIKACAGRLPEPDIVFLMNMPARVSEMLMREKEKDWHELDMAFQETVRRKYLDLAEDMGWIIVECVRDGALRSPEEIHEEIRSMVRA